MGGREQAGGSDADKCRPRPPLLPSELLDVREQHTRSEKTVGRAVVAAVMTRRWGQLEWGVRERARELLGGGGALWACVM